MSINNEDESIRQRAEDLLQLRCYYLADRYRQVCLKAIQASLRGENTVPESLPQDERLVYQIGISIGQSTNE